MQSFKNIHVTIKIVLNKNTKHNYIAVTVILFTLKQHKYN